MSELSIYADTNPKIRLWNSNQADEIKHKLAEKQIRFEQWKSPLNLTQYSDPETILSAYLSELKRLSGEQGYQSWDVMSMTEKHPKKEELREKFLSEHTHSEDEVRFFVEGEGLFCLHLDNQVWQILCQKNDLLSVPALTKHWFDMGSHPNFTAIRIFNNPEGWIAKYTGDKIADGYPKLP